MEMTMSIETLIGNELDVIIANKVFGGGPYPYSTEVQYAWQVVQELTAPHNTEGCPTYWFNCYIGATGQWCVRFDHDEHFGFELTYTVAPTFPLAICRAALKAIEHVEMVHEHPKHIIGKKDARTWWDK
jgi:hypothetical protein